MFWAAFAVAQTLDYRSAMDKAVTALKDTANIAMRDTAEKYLREALHAEPMNDGNAYVYRCLGQIYEERGKNHDALDWYGKGIDFAPSNANLRLVRANLCLRMGNSEAALKDYDAILDATPRHREALLFRADIFRKKRDYRHARSDYEFLIEIDTYNKLARIGLVLTNDAGGRPQEAMEQMDLMLQFWPKDALLYLVRGEMFMRRGIPNRAIEDFNESISLDDTNPDAYLSRAQYYMKVKKLSLANADARKALQLGGDPNEAYSIIARSRRK